MMFRKSNAGFSLLALTDSSQISALRSASGLTMWSPRQLAAFGGEMHRAMRVTSAGITGKHNKAVNASEFLSGGTHRGEPRLVI
jgi:hypothetical protein